MRGQTRLRSLAALGVVAATAVVAAQSSAPPAPAPPPVAPAGQTPGQPATVFRTGTTAVLLDIVVRDKHGRPVRDLRQDEITVLEDGVPRELRSFRLVEGRPSDAVVHGAAEPGTVQPDPLRRITLVSLVFDHLSQNARTLAGKSAQDFL